MLKLKCTCFIKYLCKVGVPVKSLRKYLQPLREREISYIVYDNINGELKVKEEYEGENKKITLQDNLGCEDCKNAIYIYEREEIKKILS